MIRNWIRKTAINHFVSKQTQPQKLKDLNEIGYDSNGLRYYSWEKLEDLPRSRFVAIEEMRIYIDSKISPRTLADISLAIIECNHASISEKDAKKKAMLHAQVTTLATELTFRQKYAIPREVLAAIAAIMSVREDENPIKYSDKIQAEKSDQFIEEMNRGNCFFLTSQIMKKLIPSLVMSQDDWKKHLVFLATQEQNVNERLKTILSKT